VGKRLISKWMTGLVMWGWFSSFLVSFVLAGTVFASLEPQPSLLKPDEMSARIELAIRTNESQDPGFLNRVDPFGSYLYQIYEADIGHLIIQLRLQEVQIYQQASELNLLVRLNDLDSNCSKSVPDCGSKGVPLIAQTDPWDFEKMLSQLGVHIVSSLPKVESSSVSNVEENQKAGFRSLKAGSDHRSPKGSIGDSSRQFFVRAFDRDMTGLDSVRTQMVSLENTSRGARGWQEASKDGSGLSSESNQAAEVYWPTLSWVDPHASHLVPIPLLSSNTIRILESKSGGQMRGGVVFGKVASHWAIKFGGEHSKHPIFLNERFDVMASEATDVPRYFIIAGVAEGSGLIQMISTQFPWSGSVRFPVLEGKATFLDLTRPAMRRIFGQVLDREVSSKAGSNEPSTVRIAGQTSPWTKTDQKNAFKMDEVLTVGNYPLFLDVEGEGRTSLRYRVLPEKLGSIVLYRMKEREIDSWRAQLNLVHQGGSSGGSVFDHQSPLVVGYLRNPIARYADYDLLPFLRQLPAKGSGESIAYVRSPGGLLEKDVYLSVHDSRILGTQAANQGFLLGFQAEGGKMLYSEWGYSSPGVVNVIGPD